MNNLKCVLSLGLAGTMLSGMMTMGASAKDFTDADTINNVDAVNTLVALNVINGKDDGSFDPKGNVTRGEMAKMIAVMMNGGNETSTGVKVNPTYSDIKGHWAESYIEYCADMGIISGRGDGTFDPYGEVTGLEAAKMVLTALGYDATAYKLTGNSWAVRTDELARQADPKLYENLDSVMMANTADRETAAQLIWNGLQNSTRYVKPTTNTSTGEVQWSYEIGGMLLNERYGAQIWVGTFDGNYNTNAAPNAGEIKVTGKLSTADASDPSTPAYVPSDLDISFIGEEFKVIFKDGNGGNKNQPDRKDVIYGVFNTGDKTVYNITKGDLQDPKSDLAAGKIKFDDTLYEVESFGITETADKVIITNYGASAVTVDNLDSTADNDGATAVEFARYIDTNLRANSADPIKVVIDANGKVEKLYVENWVYSSVLSMTSSKIQLEGVGSKDLDDVVLLDEVAVDDVVAVATFYTGTKAQYQVKKAEVIEGTIEAVDNQKIRVDGVWYKKSANTNSLGDYTDSPLTAGDEFKLVLDGGLYWVAADAITADTDYALVVKGATGINDQVKLLLTDGTEKTFIINSNSDIKYTGTTPKVSDVTTGTTDAFLVKYEIVKNGSEVKMSDVTARDVTASATHGFNKVTKVLTIDNSGTTSDKLVSDNAVAFIYDTANSEWKVVAANTMSNIASTTGTNIDYDVKSSKIAAFAMIAANAPTGTGDTTKYGYVTGKISTKHGDDAVVELTIWDGEEDYTVIVDGSTSTANKGDFVKFTVSDEPVDDSEVRTPANTVVAKIKEYDTKRNLVVTTDGTYNTSGALVSETTEGVYKVDDDTVIIGVNVADTKAATNNVITTYTKISGEDYDNAMIVYELDGSDKIIKAIFMDVDNCINNPGTGAHP